MKIVIISRNPFYYEKKNYIPELGGPAVGFVAPFVQYLLGKAHRVILLTSGTHKSYEHNFQQLFPKPPRDVNFKQLFIDPVVFPKTPYQFTGLEIEAALLQSYRLMEGIDVVLVVTVFPWFYPVGNLKKQLGYKIVASLRGSDVILGCDKRSRYGKLCNEGRWNEINNLFVQSINKHADRIFSVSHMLKDRAEELGIRTVDKIFPTPPFQSSMNLKGRHQGDSTLKKRLVSSPKLQGQLNPIRKHINKNWVIFLGRMHREKQPELAVKSFVKSKHGHAILILAGIGPELDRLIRMKESQKLRNIFFCFIPPSLVPTFCKTAKVLLHPTLPNEFVDARPSTVMNAVSVGCPVIFPYNTSKTCGGIHESVGTINTKKLGFNPFQRKNAIISQIANRLDLILHDKSLSRKITKENISFAKKFEPTTLFSEIEDEFISMLTVGKQ